MTRLAWPIAVVADLTSPELKKVLQFNLQCRHCRGQHQLLSLSISLVVIGNVGIVMMYFRVIHVLISRDRSYLRMIKYCISLRFYV